MNQYVQPSRLLRSRSFLLLTAGIYAAVAAPTAGAFDFELTEEGSGQLDVTIGYASLFRTEDSDRSDWLSEGGRYGGFNDLSERRVPDAGDLVSQVFSLGAELDLNWRNFGFVGSGTFRYDTEIMDRGLDRGDLEGTSVAWTDETRKYAGNPLELHEAYARGSFDLADNPLELRLGKQVINWGKALVFINGVSTQSAVHFNRLPKPLIGTDAFVGNNALYATLNLGEDSELAAYYQFDWNRAEFGPQGTWYGTDVSYRGALDEQANENFYQVLGFPPGAGAGAMLRLPDREARDSGQGGISFKTSLDGVEYGVYYSRYHETKPFFYGDFTANGANGTATTGFGEVFFDFGQIWAEDQDMFGLTVSTAQGNWLFAGELAYRPNQALMMDAFGKGALSNGLSGTTIQENDTAQVITNGIWSGGPTILGIDSHYAVYELGVEHISGDRSQLLINGMVTRERDGSPLNSVEQIPDKTAAGVAFNWGGTWNNVTSNTHLTLDLYLQRGLLGNSHYWGNFAERQTLYSASLIANVGDNWEASLIYFGHHQQNSDYEDQDWLALTAQYKF